MARKGVERERQRLHRGFAQVDAFALQRQYIEVGVADLDLLVAIGIGFGIAQEAQVERLDQLCRDRQVGRGAALHDIGLHLALRRDAARDRAHIGGDDEAVERDEIEPPGDRGARLGIGFDRDLAPLRRLGQRDRVGEFRHGHALGPGRRSATISASTGIAASPRRSSATPAMTCARFAASGALPRHRLRTSASPSASDPSAAR